MVTSRSDGEYSVMEQKIASIFCKVLEYKEVGLDDNFFELGGNSFLALKLEIEMEKADIAVKNFDITKFKTVRQITEFVTGKWVNEAGTGDNEKGYVVNHQLTHAVKLNGKLEPKPALPETGFNEIQFSVIDHKVSGIIHTLSPSVIYGTTYLEIARWI